MVVGASSEWSMMYRDFIGTVTQSTRRLPSEGILGGDCLTEDIRTSPLLRAFPVSPRSPYPLVPLVGDHSPSRPGCREVTASGDPACNLNTCSFRANATPYHTMDTNEDSPSACVGGRALPPIFKLPDETLLTIAGLLAENRHLVQLSRVNTKFRHVAQEALVKRAILPPNGIGKLVKMYVATSLLSPLANCTSRGCATVPILRPRSRAWTWATTSTKRRTQSRRIQGQVRPSTKSSRIFSRNVAF